MRIAFGDFIGALPVETVAQQLTTLAEAILETAISAARREAAARYGVPIATNGRPARVAVIGYGALGAMSSVTRPAWNCSSCANQCNRFRAVARAMHRTTLSAWPNGSYSG